MLRQTAVDIGGRRGAKKIPVSVSIGIAVFPDHGATAEQLLEAADDALYAAKEAGRDTYRLAEVTGDIAGQAAVVPSTGGTTAVPPVASAGKPGAPGGGPQPPRARRGR